MPLEPPELLTEGLMLEFLDAIARAGGHLADQLLPPLPANDLHLKVVRETGLTLPDEAMVWWSLHNGVPEQFEFQGMPAGRLLGIEQAIRDCHLLRNCSAGYVSGMLRAQLPPLATYEAWWFPMLRRHGDVLSLDASVAAWGPSPVRRYMHTPNAFEGHRISARSIGELVRTWIRAVDDGLYRYDEKRGAWDPYWDRLTDWQKRSGIL